MAAPDDTVFILARPSAGRGMPVAILRKNVRDLPIQFSLDADDRNRAALFADDLAAQMRLARTTSLPAAQLTAFESRVQGIDPVTSQATGLGLPDATLTVTAGATPNLATITIRWRHPGEPSGQYSQLVSDVVLTAEEMM